MTERFVSAAEMMSRVLGMPGYAFAVIDHPVSSATDDGLARDGASNDRAGARVAETAVDRPRYDPACCSGGIGHMVRVVGIDHISIRVSDFGKSKAFYSRLMEFLGFEIEAEYPGAMGWKNGHTLFWIGEAEGAKPTTSATSACITMPSGCAAEKTSTTSMLSFATI